MLSFLCAGERKKPAPAARIVGVHRLERELWDQQLVAEWDFVTGLGLVSIVAVIVIEAILLWVSSPSSEFWPMLFFATIGCLGLAYVMLRSRVRLKRRNYFES